MVERSRQVQFGGLVAAVGTADNETYLLRLLAVARTTVRPTYVTDGNPCTVAIDSL